MKTSITQITAIGGVAMIALAAALYAESGASASSSTTASGITTNDNGSVSRVFTESTVTTNGNMVTEHRRETRTTLDADGNLLESSTSEYAQSYPVGDGEIASLSRRLDGAKQVDKAEGAADCDSFMGVKFGSEVKEGEFVEDASEPTLLRTAFKPKKALAGFNDYYVYVTPTTHRAVKVYACAKNAVDSGSSWRRNYLIEALEKRYQTWARPRSWCRPVYTFDLGSDRYVTAALEGATRDYETVVVAWDENMLRAAAEEAEEIRREARKNAAEKRKARVNDAAEAF